MTQKSKMFTLRNLVLAENLEYESTWEKKDKNSS